MLVLFHRLVCTQLLWTLTPCLFVCLFFSLVVNCTDPGIPANSIRKSKIEFGNFTFGTVVSYDCNPGYYLFGAAVLTCQPVAHWDRPLPECIGAFLKFYWFLFPTYKKATRKGMKITQYGSKTGLPDFSRNPAE